MSDSAGKVDPTAPQRRTVVKRGKRRWLGRFFSFIALVTLFWLGKAPLLKGMGSLLVCDKPVQPGDYLFVIDCEGCYDKAAGLYHAGTVPRVLLTKYKTNLLADLGVLPADDELAVQQLEARSVPRDAIDVLPGGVDSDWDRARRLEAWLGAHPEHEVTVLGPRLGSMRLRRIFLATLDRSDWQRVHWLGVPSPRYDEHNWWQCKEGVLAFFDGWAGLVSVGLWGEDRAGFAT